MADNPRYAESRWSKGPIYIGPLGDPDEFDKTRNLRSIGLRPGEGATSDREMIPRAVHILKNETPKWSRERMFLETQIPQDRGSMYINPDPDPVRNSNLFRHEAAHNLLGNALNKTDENQHLRTLRGWHKQPRMKPYADQVKRALRSGGWMGEPEKEVPAYMATRDPDVDVAPNVQKGYMRELMRLMQRSNPREAAILRRMGESVIGEK